jgi:hypothetical protein
MLIAVGLKPARGGMAKSTAFETGRIFREKILPVF